MLVLKRHANRHLYNPEIGRRTTLAEIAVLIKEGRKIKVVDYDHKDVTRQVLGEIVARFNLISVSNSEFLIKGGIQ